MIESLTPEQIARFPFYVEKWLKHGLSTETNRAKAEEVIDRVYAVGGWPAPQYKIWMRSPLEGAIAASLLAYPNKTLGKSPVGSEVRDQVWAQVRSQVAVQVGDQIGDHIRDRVAVEVEAQAWNQVWDQVRSHIRDRVAVEVEAQAWNQVWAQVRSQVAVQVGDQLRAQVRDQAGDQIEAQLGAQLGAQLETHFWDQVRNQPLTCGSGSHDSDFLSFYDFFRSEGIVSGLDPVVPLMELAACAGWFWPFSGLVILTDNPVEIHMSQKKLHKDGGPTMRYADDFCVYSLNGVRVSKEIAETPANELSSQFVLSEKNAEVRREIVRKIGMARICQDLGAKVIDRWKDYELLELDLGDERRRAFLKMINKSIDTIHIEGVPPEIQTVKQALAWRNGMESFKEPKVLT